MRIVAKKDAAAGQTATAAPDLGEMVRNEMAAQTRAGTEKAAAEKFAAGQLADAANDSLAPPAAPSLDTGKRDFRLQAANYIKRFVAYANAGKLRLDKRLAERIKYAAANFKGIGADILRDLIADMAAAAAAPAPVEAKLKPKVKARLPEEPKEAKAASAFPGELDVEGVGRMSLVEGIGYDDFRRAVEDEERELYIAWAYTPKAIREFEYELRKEVKAPKKFPDDIDVCQPVYFSDGLKRVVYASVYTEGVGRVHAEDFDGRSSAGILFEIYELPDAGEEDGEAEE
jgi:hypothetical protein